MGKTRGMLDLDNAFDQVDEEKERRDEQERALAREVLEECRVSLMMSFRFLDSALWRLPFEMADVRLPMATDGMRLYCNPRAAIRRFHDDPNELVRDFLHAVLHCVFRQPFSTERAEPVVWSQVCDVCIESFALEMCDGRFPSAGDGERVPAIATLRGAIGPLTPAKLYRAALRLQRGDEADRDECARLAEAGVSLELLVGADGLFARDSHELWDLRRPADKESRGTQQAPSDGEGADSSDDDAGGSSGQPGDDSPSEDASEGGDDAAGDGNPGRKGDDGSDDGSNGGDGADDDAGDDAADEASTGRDGERDGADSDDGNGARGGAGEDAADEGDDDRGGGSDGADQPESDDDGGGAADGADDRRGDDRTQQPQPPRGGRDPDAASRPQSQQGAERGQRGASAQAMPAGGFDQGEDAPYREGSLDEVDATLAEADWEEIGKRLETDLETLAHGQGEGAGDLMANLALANRRPVDYKDFLRRFSTVAEDMRLNDDEFDYIYYTYGMDHFGNMPLIEPLEYQETNRVREFVIALDTSGSCAGDLVRTFVTRTYEILKDSASFGDKICVHVVQCDAKIHSDQVIHSIDELERYGETMQVAGFGGTDFRPVFAYVDELIAQGEFKDLRGLIYFTDGQGTYPAKPPDYDVAFVFVEEDGEKRRVPPWAMRVVIDEDRIREL